MVRQGVTAPWIDQGSKRSPGGVVGGVGEPEQVSADAEDEEGGQSASFGATHARFPSGRMRDMPPNWDGDRLPAVPIAAPRVAPLRYGAAERTTAIATLPTASSDSRDSLSSVSSIVCQCW